MKIKDIKIGESYAYANGQKFKAVAIEDDVVVCWNPESKSALTFKPEQLSPIKTPTENLRDETIEMARDILDGDFMPSGGYIARKLYDAGMLVKPCQNIDLGGFEYNEHGRLIIIASIIKNKSQKELHEILHIQADEYEAALKQNTELKKRISGLEADCKYLQKCFDECYEELRLTRDELEQS